MNDTTTPFTRESAMRHVNWLREALCGETYRKSWGQGIDHILALCEYVEKFSGFIMPPRSTVDQDKTNDMALAILEGLKLDDNK